MFPVGQHPIYSYTEEDKRIVLENVGLTEAQLEIDVNTLKDWIQKQPHLAEAGLDSHAAAFHLIMTKGSVEKAKRIIDFYYRERGRSISHIQDRIRLLKEHYRPVWESHVIAPAPKLFKGLRVTYTKITDWEKFKMEDVFVNMSILADIRLANDFSSGEVWIIDAEKITLRHLMKLNFMEMHRAYWIMRKGLSLRMSAIHVLNCGASNIIQACLNILKQILSKKILDRIQFHDRAERLREHLPSEYILEDYGGDLPSYEAYRDKMERMVTDEKTKQFLLDACKVVSDESKRLSSEYNEDYLPGNFKKLDLD